MGFGFNRFGISGRVGYMGVFPGAAPIPLFGPFGVFPGAAPMPLLPPEPFTVPLAPAPLLTPLPLNVPLPLTLPPELLPLAPAPALAPPLPPPPAPPPPLLPAPCAAKTIAVNKVNATAARTYLFVFMPFHELYECQVLFDGIAGFSGSNMLWRNLILGADFLPSLKGLSRKAKGYPAIKGVLPKRDRVVFLEG
jgi:hypothetical protein